MAICEHRSGAYTQVREHRSAEERHLQAGSADFETVSMTHDVAIIMGSQSDWATMRHAAETLDALGITHLRT